MLPWQRELIKGTLMKWIRWSVLVLGLIAGPAMAEVYKCETASGTVFQGTPCAGGAEALSLKRGVSVVNSPEYNNRLSVSTQLRIEREKRQAAQHGAAANQAYEQRQLEKQQARIARQTGIVAEGMSERDAIRQYGRPDSTNVSQSGGRSCKHLRWRDPYRTVMVCDGEVRRSYAQGVN